MTIHLEELWHFCDDPICPDPVRKLSKEEDGWQDLMMHEQPTPAAQAILEEKLQDIVEDILPKRSIKTEITMKLH